MQNRAYRQKTHLWMLLLAGIVGICALGGVAAAPQEAYAKSYTMPQTTINAQAQNDGSLRVVEERVFDFDGSFSAVWWDLGILPDGGSTKINGVSLARANTSGGFAKGLPEGTTGNAAGSLAERPVALAANAREGAATSLPELPFVLSWRDSGGPSQEAYSFDSPQNTVYVFFRASDEKVKVTLDYTVTNGVQAYKDVAEVYWKYIGDQWAAASEDVTMTLTLPAPDNAVVTPGSNVRAWGHGPLDGTVAFNSDASITYKVPRVGEGQFAEARVVFPVSWLTGLSGKDALAHADQLRLDSVLKEEQAWADRANQERILALAQIIVCVLVSVLLLLWAIRAYFKHGKEHAPDFTDQYWRDVPSETDHPAVIARLWRWNRESTNDLAATLMYLSHRGAIKISKGSYEKPGAFGKKTVDDYYMTRVAAVADTLTNPIDKKTMKFLFEEIGAGADSVWFGSIAKYGKEDARGFMGLMLNWQGAVTAETNKRSFFEPKGKSLQLVMAALAGIWIVLGLAADAILENFFPTIICVPTGIALFVIAKYMPRRSPEGSTIEAKCKALRNWLKDFSALDERPVTDVLVWGELMVYASLFGVAEQVIRDLRIKMPELFQEDMQMTGFVPWWFWYTPSRGATGSVMPSITDMLQTSVANTVRTAQAATSAASGSFSSGGGGGGGFSGGGGGGFGGGGGGAR
ncbi:MAG: DUF2207 domain-containing protein [Coriobacteriaceae bacterium]|jgi:uncharacterized membrane protein|nr:DUF2207 domain-containing protein [Coriobacteriaceae bacterium]